MTSTRHQTNDNDRKSKRQTTRHEACPFRSLVLGNCLVIGHWSLVIFPGGPRMTFLNWSILFGLIAVAIPTVIHLLNRRRAKSVQWGAMRFLLASVASRNQRILLEEMLLMILRCLTVALVVLAIARPYLPTRGAGSTWWSCRRCWRRRSWPAGCGAARAKTTAVDALVVRRGAGGGGAWASITSRRSSSGSGTPEGTRTWPSSSTHPVR